MGANDPRLLVLVSLADGPRHGHAMVRDIEAFAGVRVDRKSTRLNSSHTEIYTLSLHDALPIYGRERSAPPRPREPRGRAAPRARDGSRYRGVRWRAGRSEEHTSELQSHRDLHSFPTRRSSDLWARTIRASSSS